MSYVSHYMIYKRLSKEYQNQQNRYLAYINNSKNLNIFKPTYLNINYLIYIFAFYLNIYF